MSESRIATHLSFCALLKLALHNCEPIGHGINVSLISRLDSLGAFAGRPALRFIASTAIKSGAAQRFAMAPDSTSAAMELTRFLNHTGFRQEAAAMFFDSLASCLPTNAPSARTTATCTTGPQAESYPAASSISGNVAEESVPYESPAQGTIFTDDAVSSATDGSDRLNSLLTADNSNAASCGVAIDNPAVIDLTPKGAVVTCVLRRTNAMGTAALHCTATDSAGRVIESIICGVLTIGGPAVLAVKSTIPLPSPASVASLRLWLD